MCASDSCCCTFKAHYAFAKIFLVVGILLCGFANFFPSVIYSKLDTALNELVIIDAKAQQDNNAAYRTWVNPDDPDSVPVTFSVYLFHITNPDAVVNGSAPNFVEKGPYPYRRRQYKRNVVFSKNDYGQDLVTFYYETTYDFLGNAALEDEQITMLNVPFMFLRTNPALSGFYHTMPERDRLFSTRSVREWLFGFTDTAWTLVANAVNNAALFPRAFPGLIQKQTTPDALPTVAFVGSGSDPNELRRMFKWQGLDYAGNWRLTTTSTGAYTRVPAANWASARAGYLHGTDSSQFKRNIKEGEILYTYVSQTYRTVPIENKMKVTYKDIDLLRYTVPKSFLGNYLTTPSNADYYSFGYNGILNVSSPTGASFFVSKPKYLDCDAAVFNSMTGLAPPTTEAHDTYVDVEPMTGISMRGAKRLQLSGMISAQNVTFQAPVGNTTVTVSATWFTKVPQNQYFPIYWAEESAIIPDDKAKKFVSQVLGAKKAADGLYWGGWFAGFVCLLAAAVFYTVSIAKAKGEFNMVDLASPKSGL